MAEISGEFLVPEILRKKRDGGRLSQEEILFLVDGFARGSIPDYQASAWLMASYLKGLDATETVALTTAMKNSGRSLEWRKLSPKFVPARFADKHSSGGVGDKVSLVLAPLAACLDLKVPMMSGRGLGHTGGTVDKLLTIPGFTMSPDEATMIRCLEEYGICMMSQGADLCPADRKLYSLRDVTATVENISLITASIVSKKWAEGVDAIVYDVKCGSAAFMENVGRARELAQSLVRVSKGAGMQALACITRMEEPLGAMIGNALEVRECAWMLEDRYPTDNHRRLAAPLVDLTCELTAHMALQAGTRHDLKKTLEECRTNLKNGRAWAIFQKMLVGQGAPADALARLPQTKESYPLAAPRTGVVRAIHSRAIGLAGIRCGAGRKTTDDHIDAATGFEMTVGVGDRVQAGAPLLNIHVHSAAQADALKAELLSAFVIEDGSSFQPEPLVMETVT